MRSLWLRSLYLRPLCLRSLCLRPLCLRPLYLRPSYGCLMNLNQHPRRCPTPLRAERLGAAGNGPSARAKNDRLTCDRRSWCLLLTVALVGGGGALAVELVYTKAGLSITCKVLGAKSR